MQKLVLFTIWIFYFGFALAQDQSVSDSLESKLKIVPGKDKAKIHLELASRFLEEGNFEKVILNASSALQLSRNFNDLRNEAASFKLMGDAFYKNGKHADAIGCLSESVKIKSDIGDKKGVADCYSQLGLVYGNQTNYQESFRYLQLSLNLSEEIGYENGVLAATNNLGLIHSRRDELPEALNYYLRALRIREKSGDRRGSIGTLNNIGIIFKKQKKYKEALETYLQALQIIQETGDKKSLARTYTNIGTIHSLQNNFEEAISSHMAALNFADEAGDQKSLGDTYNNLGVAYKKRGTQYRFDGDSIRSVLDFNKALSYHLKGLSIRESLNNQALIAASCSNIGLVYTSLEMYDSSRVYLERGLSIGAHLNNTETLSNIYGALSALDSAQASHPATPQEERAGYWSRAYRNFRRYALMKDSILNTESQAQIAEINTRFQTEKKDNEIQLLKKENELKALQLKDERNSLYASVLETQKRRNEVSLLSRENEIRKLQLFNSVMEGNQRSMEVKAKTSELERIRKESRINEQELENQKLLRNGMIGGVVMLAVVFALLFNRYQLRKKLEKQEVINRERKRISSDMHDDLAGGLTSIRMLSEIAKKKSTEHPIAEIEKISRSAETLMDNIRDIIWAISTENNTLDDLVLYIRKYASEFLEISSIQYSFQVPEPIPQMRLSAEQKRNIFLTVKECLHNVVKHSRASEVLFRFDFEKGIKISITDNGMGMDLNGATASGNGLRNMKSRMELINGKFRLENKIGTTVHLDCPVVNAV